MQCNTLDSARSRARAMALEASPSGRIRQVGDYAWQPIEGGPGFSSALDNGGARVLELSERQAEEHRTVWYRLRIARELEKAREQEARAAEVGPKLGAGRLVLAKSHRKEAARLEAELEGTVVVKRPSVAAPRVEVRA